MRTFYTLERDNSYEHAFDHVSKAWVVTESTVYPYKVVRRTTIFQDNDKVWRVCNEKAYSVSQDDEKAVQVARQHVKSGEPALCTYWLEGRKVRSHRVPKGLVKAIESLI